ncbi:hypothetical protein DSO57_1013498 [Entomophthora muscae]|uniref:Uncharacterized protein n=1 Tax=Entomophthora muscae TaxID=34485 RepID=A0ACC2SUW7_9FUNG|nr:hypothetical protein DSO57_1013498 [Entomophthora muscae]
MKLFVFLLLVFGEELRLENGMQVVLVSKPGLGESGVGLSIEAGSRDEPASVPGLAHLLEHMVSFEMLEEMAGGIGNGHTDYDRTRFDFQVRPGLLEKTLAKLSKAVSSPVFDSAAVEREARMIELEHMKNMDDEMARLDQAMRVMSNTHHPFSRFYTGTYKTLTCKAKALSHFHAKFYHPHLMKLAIVDARPIHELKQLVMQSFSSLKGKPLTKRTKPNVKPFLPQHTGFEMKIKASSKRIFLQFEVPPGETLEVLSRILAHRAKGSILQLLKARAWAYNLECFVFDYSDLTIFTIKISPTNAGINHREDILAIFFSYIDFLKLSSPHSLQAIADEHHTHLSPRTHALLLTTTTPQNNYSHSHFLKTLNKLTPTNLRMFTTGIQIPPTSPIEHWYNTHYQLQPLPQIQPHKHTFLLPHKNILLPNHTTPQLTNILISFPHNIQTPAIANLLTTYLNLHFSLPLPTSCHLLPSHPRRNHPNCHWLQPPTTPPPNNQTTTHSKNQHQPPFPCKTIHHKLLPKPTPRCPLPNPICPLPQHMVQPRTKITHQQSLPLTNQTRIRQPKHKGKSQNIIKHQSTLTFPPLQRQTSPAHPTRNHPPPSQPCCPPKLILIPQHTCILPGHVSPHQYNPPCHCIHCPLPHPGSPHPPTALHGGAGLFHSHHPPHHQHPCWILVSSPNQAPT